MINAEVDRAVAARGVAWKPGATTRGDGRRGSPSSATASGSPLGCGAHGLPVAVRRLGLPPTFRAAGPDVRDRTSNLRSAVTLPACVDRSHDSVFRCPQRPSQSLGGRRSHTRAGSRHRRHSLAKCPTHKRSRTTSARQPSCELALTGLDVWQLLTHYLN